MVHALLQSLYSFALYRGIWRLLPAVVRLMPAPGLHTCKEAVARPPYPQMLECIRSSIRAHYDTEFHCAHLLFCLKRSTRLIHSASPSDGSASMVYPLLAFHARLGAHTHAMVRLVLYLSWQAQSAPAA